MGLDEISPGGFGIREPSLKPVELLVGGGDPLLEVRDLGGAVLTKNPSFGDGNLGCKEMCRPYRDSA